MSAGLPGAGGTDETLAMTRLNAGLLVGGEHIIIGTEGLHVL